MNKPNFKGIINTVKTGVAKHSPEILTGVGVGCCITSTILAVKATPKACMLMEEAQAEKEDILTVPEKVKAAWKPYIPAAVSGVVGVSCIIGASSVNAKRNAALATAYNLSQTALTEYKAKIVETIGEKKEQKVRESIAKDHINDNPSSSNSVIITDKGDTLCYDAVSKRYFKSDIDRIKKAENNLNKRMLDEMYISLNDFYDEIGLDHLGVGDDLGWEINRDGYIDIDFSTQLAENDQPCIVIDFLVAPRYDYDKLI